MPTYDAAVRLELHSPNPNLETENWHIGYSHPGERLCQFWFLVLFYFRVRSSYGTDGQTHGRARLVMRFAGRIIEETNADVFKARLCRNVLCPVRKCRI